MAGFVWVCEDYGINGPEVAIPALIITALAGILMVSNILYYSFKEINLRGKVPFLAILIIVLAFALASIHPPAVLFLVFLGYIISGPLLSLVRRFRKIGNKRSA